MLRPITAAMTGKVDIFDRIENAFDKEYPGLVDSNFLKINYNEVWCRQ